MLQCCVCRRRPSVCTKCIVAKRCVLEQKLLLTAYRKSYRSNSWHAFASRGFVSDSWAFLSYHNQYEITKSCTCRENNTRLYYEQRIVQKCTSCRDYLGLMLSQFQG